MDAGSIPAASTNTPNERPPEFGATLHFHSPNASRALNKLNVKHDQHRHPN